MRGIISKCRSTWDHPIVGRKNPARYIAWDWILFKASWKDREVFVNGAKIRLARGQLAVSLRTMAEEVGMTLKQLRCFLSALERDGMVSKTGTPEGTPKGKGVTVLTLCNYDNYQRFDNYKAHQEEQQRAQQGHTRGTLGAHDRTTEETTEETTEGTTDSNPPKPPAVADEPDPEPEQPQELILSAPAGPDDFTAAVAMWNAMADRQENIRTVQKGTEVRKTRMKARLKECGGLSGWQIAIEKIEGSDFLLGLTGGKWVANFDWVLSEGNFTKLMEGNYDQLNRKGVEQARGAAGALNQAFDELAAELNDGGRL